MGDCRGMDTWVACGYVVYLLVMFKVCMQRSTLTAKVDADPTQSSKWLSAVVLFAAIGLAGGAAAAVLVALVLALFQVTRSDTAAGTLKKAATKALGGGIPGMIAMILNVFLLMWMRTVINYQYRHGGSFSQVCAALWAQGGIARFYQGVGPALLQGPLSRFGDTAANEGVKALLENAELPVMLTTLAASVAAGSWRIFITPLDTIKTVMQVSGTAGMDALMAKVAAEGVIVLYEGALGTWLATLAGHYPWFVTFNTLDTLVPKQEGMGKLLRNAFLGTSSSMVSDLCSNSIRVVKVFKLTSESKPGYLEAIKMIVASDGISGLVFRGLGVKVASNAVSAMLFTVMWKKIMEMWNERNKETGAAPAEADAKAVKPDVTTTTSKNDECAQ